MAMPRAAEFHTAEMVRALIDESRPSPRYETVYGELLVTPAPNPRHQLVLGRLFLALSAYCAREALGHVFMSPADISWQRPDVLVQPDLFVVPVEEARSMSWRRISRLLLAVEILSPSSVRADRFTKRRLYQEMGTPAYWLVDADAGQVEVWTPDAVIPRVERDQVEWSPAGASEPLAVSIAELVAPI